MTTYEKAAVMRQNATHFAAQLRAEGNSSEAALFDEMTECSDEGLAVMYDAMKTK